MTGRSADELLIEAAALLTQAAAAIREERRQLQAMTRDEADAYGVPEAAKRLGVSADTLHRRLKAGEIPSLLVGGRRLITAKAIREYLRQNEQVYRPEPLDAKTRRKGS